MDPAPNKAHPTSPQKQTAKNRSKSTDEVQRAKKVENLMLYVHLLMWMQMYLESSVAESDPCCAGASAPRGFHRPAVQTVSGSGGHGQICPGKKASKFLKVIKPLTKLIVQVLTRERRA
ncbi:hypothetical protein DPEC_G00237030 [Dallia pectoralis]|uniref:Uncharacterized protein n=1 Tax=Dallia pectoralis TaxID=75939 RepID=A0ACC2FYF6_DALPE|nr:hypothetical protein DPEC_G00237030 [Dallia pectoralis]